MKRRLISSSDSTRRRAPLRPIGSAPPLTARWMRARYEFSALGVALACVVAAAGELAFSRPPLILLAAAVAVASSVFGLGPGLFALAVATLAGDLFFVHPKNVLSFDQRSLGLGCYYGIAGLVSYLYTRGRWRAMGCPPVISHTSRRPHARVPGGTGTRPM
jgi:K+-sensing histidine kinase KdpD